MSLSATSNNNVAIIGGFSFKLTAI